MIPALMFQGTGSDVGKSVLTAGLRSPTLVLIGSVVSLLDTNEAAASVVDAARAAACAEGGAGVQAWHADELLDSMRRGGGGVTVEEATVHAVKRR